MPKFVEPAMVQPQSPIPFYHNPTRPQSHATASALAPTPLLGLGDALVLVRRPRQPDLQKQGKVDTAPGSLGEQRVRGKRPATTPTLRLRRPHGDAFAAASPPEPL
jgi:hypothetical protein